MNDVMAMEIDDDEADKSDEEDDKDEEEDNPAIRVLRHPVFVPYTARAGGDRRSFRCKERRGSRQRLSTLSSLPPFKRL